MLAANQACVAGQGDGGPASDFVKLSLFWVNRGQSRSNASGSVPINASVDRTDQIKSRMGRLCSGEASLGRAAELAGLPLGQMITILTEFGVESRLEKEDYLQGIRNLHKVW